MLVAVVLMIPLALWSTRVKARGVAWRGIDWSRGMSEAAKLVAEGVRLHRAGELARALDAFDRALTLEPDLADGLLARARTRHRLGRLDGALADYDRAI